jgi:hypothetical protein
MTQTGGCVYCDRKKGTTYKLNEEIMKSTADKFTTLSLVSTVSTGILTSVHHVYDIGFGGIILALVVVALPMLSMRQFRQRGSKVALWVYRLLTAWLVFGFGLVDGLWNHIIRPLGFQLQALLSFHGGGTKAVEKAVEWNFIYEGTGILTFVASMFAAYYGYKFIRTSRQPVNTGAQDN